MNAGKNKSDLKNIAGLSKTKPLSEAELQELKTNGKVATIKTVGVRNGKPVVQKVTIAGLMDEVEELKAVVGELSEKLDRVLSLLMGGESSVKQTVTSFKTPLVAPMKTEDLVEFVPVPKLVIEENEKDDKTQSWDGVIVTGVIGDIEPDNQSVVIWVEIPEFDFFADMNSQSSEGTMDSSEAETVETKSQIVEPTPEASVVSVDDKKIEEFDPLEGLF